MPVLNFKKRFAPDVESGKKRQTVRAMRKRPFKYSDRLYLYEGARTKKCRKLGEADVISVEDISILSNGSAFLSGKMLKLFHLDEIARRDGFGNWFEMWNWFQDVHGLPFEGQLIRWGSLIKEGLRNG